MKDVTLRIVIFSSLHPTSACQTPPIIVIPLHDGPMFTGRLAILWTLGTE